MFILGTLLYISTHVKKITRLKVVVLHRANQTVETTVSFVCPFFCRNFPCVVGSEVSRWLLVTNNQPFSLCTPLALIPKTQGGIPHCQWPCHPVGSHRISTGSIPLSQPAPRPPASRAFLQHQHTREGRSKLNWTDFFLKMKVKINKNTDWKRFQRINFF